MEDIKQIPSFLTKLYEILESEQSAIGWNKEGTTFQISDPSILTDEILPQYFKHRNYQSFLRQLNMYGFKKLKNKQGKSEFQHPQFRKGVRTNLLKIRRRNQDDIKQTLESLTKEFQQESYLNEHERLRQKLLEIQNQQKNLLEEIKRQTERNKNLQRETQDITEKINNVKAFQLSKLNKLIVIIQKLPKDAQISKMAMLKEKILRKLEAIDTENFYIKELPLERQDSYSHHEPNLTGVRSPAGFSPKTQ